MHKLALTCQVLYDKDYLDNILLLKKKLRTNNVSDRKSACFWCTCNFDNPSIHIPMKYENECYEVYGCQH